MGRITNLIGRIESKVQTYTQTFKKEFYNPEESSPAMPQNKYAQIYPDLKIFDDNYKKLKEMRENIDELDEKGKSELEEIKVAMLDAAESIFNKFSQLKDYSIYRNELAKIGSQLAKLKGREFKTFVEDDNEQ